MASSNQLAYLLHLLGRAGYSTMRMDDSFRDLGATVEQCSGSVRSWLHQMDNRAASDLIERLKRMSAS